MDILSTNKDGLAEAAADPDAGDAFAALIAVLRRLRGPDGCPWDRRQTLQSLRPYLVEEAFEVVAAVDENNVRDVAEELGDVFLVAALMALLVEESTMDPLSSLFQYTREKLIRRHPHVFGSTVVAGADEVLVNWERIKGSIEGRSLNVSDAGKGLPPLLRALEVQKKAAKLGFDWPSIAPIFDKMREEIVELENAIDREAVVASRIEQEVGDVLFTVVNLSRALKVDPGIALQGTTQRFLRRFGYIEQQLQQSGRAMADASLEELDALWDEAKVQLSVSE